MDNEDFRTSKLCINDSNDTSLNEPTDDDSFLLEDDNVTFEVNEEKSIEQEFEDYLKDEEVLCENNETKKSKLERMNSIEFSFENYEELKKLAVEKYGFVNKKFRRKAWPILILYKNRAHGTPDLIMESSKSFYEKISKIYTRKKNIKKLNA